LYSIGEIRRAQALTDKELKRMSHAELIEIIYRYEQTLQELTAERDKLAEQVRDRSIRLQEAGSIAEASLALNKIFETAQQAADQYIASIRASSERVEAETEGILTRARREAEELRARGQREYEEKLAQAERECSEMRRRITDLLLLDSDLGTIVDQRGE